MNGVNRHQSPYWPGSKCSFCLNGTTLTTKSVDKLAICARVRQAREQAGLEQHEIAEMLMPAVTDRTIRNWEKDRPPFRRS